MIPNITLVIQGLVFFTVAWLVMKLGWPHIIGAIEERQAKIAEGLAAADRARQELADADARVADEIRKARVDAAAIIEKANQQANQIVDKARTDAVVEGAKQRRSPRPRSRACRIVRARSCAARSARWQSPVPRRSSSARSTPARTRI
jgi:F0F1-type ATP synthase membrane subunit b/b'